MKQETSVEEPKTPPSQKTKDGYTLALDHVEMGTDENTYGLTERVEKTLPEGVEPKMLYKDILHIAWPSLIELTLTQLASA